VVRRGREVRLHDLGSKNGTWIGGVRVETAILEPSVRFRVGGTSLEASVDRQRLTRAGWHGGDGFGSVVGASAAMHELFALAARAAASDEPILLRGESGTGKEALARTVHDASRRADGPFVVLDCAALSSGIADVEIFGHEQGAFTGATRERPGVFERANGGTLLLDEVAELPMDLQPKLLRALDRGEVRRLGAEETRTVDVRILSATHVRLEERVNDDTFREDLLHRLSVIELRVPPLRERGRDAVVISARLLDAAGVTDPATRDSVERLVSERIGYRWPGNVRELRSFVRRAALLGGGHASVDPAADLETPSMRLDLPYHEARRRYVHAFERAYLAQLLEEAGGNVSEAARRSGLNRQYVYEMLERLGLTIPRV